MKYRLALRPTNISFFSLKAIHCEWDAWNLGECSAECGLGTQKNTRTKLVEEANGGTCSGQPEEVVECMIKECPGKSINFLSSKLISVKPISLKM